jgi:hypothetical protein
VCGDSNVVPDDFIGYGVGDAHASVKDALKEK